MWPIIPGITTHMPLHNKENPPKMQAAFASRQCMRKHYSLNNFA